MIPDKIKVIGVLKISQPMKENKKDGVPKMNRIVSSLNLNIKKTNSIKTNLNLIAICQWYSNGKVNTSNHSFKNHPP